MSLKQETSIEQLEYINHKEVGVSLKSWDEELGAYVYFNGVLEVIKNGN